MRIVRWEQIAKMVDGADIVLEVIDAREPEYTRSRRLEGHVLKRGKVLMVVLNKCDLVPQGIAYGWVERFSAEGLTCICTSSKSMEGIDRLRGLMLRYARSRSRARRMHARSALWMAVTGGKSVALVVGYPKTGKSSLINALRRRHGAGTSPVPGSPGYTRGVQAFRIADNLYMYDTPGMLPVEIEHVDPVAYAVRCAAPEELSDPVEPACRLLERALIYNPDAVKDAYGVSTTNPYEILEEIARRRGWFYRSDGEPLLEEAARTVIRDYHNARLRFYIPPPDHHH
ncbi:MAG: GTPase [Candidatus Nitrosocaldus sp.]|nr:50S ribosome-binding GTPase [Candidatus Nitrosocaldus sp.]MCS7141955.1 50S ribosome-binding GTPase [Candidatus Nitrosocaldus sp.]MDW8000628.1 GTPase [Candidatus Nitrosocaldus sp.]MDW8275981.1 GTPase [Candidatus Nitrosocaldus sp.]